MKTSAKRCISWTHEERAFWSTRNVLTKRSVRRSVSAASASTHRRSVHSPIHSILRQCCKTFLSIRVCPEISRILRCSPVLITEFRYSTKNNHTLRQIPFKFAYSIFFSNKTFYITLSYSIKDRDASTRERDRIGWGSTYHCCPQASLPTAMERRSHFISNKTGKGRIPPDNPPVSPTLLAISSRKFFSPASKMTYVSSGCQLTNTSELTKYTNA